MRLEQVQPVRLPINTLMDVVTTRRRSLEMALALGFPRPEATKIAAAVSELGRHCILYTRGGVITLFALATERKGLKIVVHSQGSAFSNVDLTLASTCLTAQRSALSSAQRLMDEFEIRAVSGGGVTITAVKWLR